VVLADSRRGSGKYPCRVISQTCPRLTRNIAATSLSDKKHPGIRTGAGAADFSAMFFSFLIFRRNEKIPHQRLKDVNAGSRLAP
jgi:hypothetical protein